MENVSELEQEYYNRAVKSGLIVKPIEYVTSIAERIKDVDNEWRSRYGGKFTLFEHREATHFLEALSHAGQLDNTLYGRITKQDVLRSIRHLIPNPGSQYNSRIIEIGLGKPETAPEIERLRQFQEKVGKLHIDCRNLLQLLTELILIDDESLVFGCQVLDILEKIIGLSGDMSPESVAEQIGAYMKERQN